MAKPGRKKIDIDSHLPEIERLASLGLNQREICLSLGFSHQTLAKYKKINVELVDAIKRGQAASHKALTNVLHSAAVGEGNLSAAMFLLKSQFNYRDHGPVPGEEEPENIPSMRIVYQEIDGTKREE